MPENVQWWVNKTAEMWDLKPEGTKTERAAAAVPPMQKYCLGFEKGLPGLHAMCICKRTNSDVIIYRASLKSHG